MSGKVSRYAKLPSSGELCCVVAEIDLNETKDSSAKSNFHWKTMKCRLLLHTMKDAVIATPIFQTTGLIHVVVGMEFFKTGVLQKTLKEINMTWSTPRPVTPDVYGNCLRYSLIFALAPEWNKVGEFLINEKQFLTVTENSTAMRLNLTLKSKPGKEAEACLNLQPLKVKLCEHKLEDLGLPEMVVAYFMSSRNGKIDIASFGNHRVTVLPSLKRGKIMAVMKKIPATSPFKDYGELRRHWKNMYGYRLPETDDGLIYYEVYFPMPDTDCFLYPSICVRSQIVELPYRGSRDILVQSFLQDVSEALPMICGGSLQIVDASLKNDNSSSSTAASLPRAVEMIKDEPSIQEQAESIPATYRTPKYELRRRTSTLMSPTPSLRGTLSVRNEISDRFHAFITRIAQPREHGVKLILEEMKENRERLQNEDLNVRIHREDTKLVKATISSPMEVEAGAEDRFILEPVENFNRPGKSSQGPSTSHRHNNAEMKDDQVKIQGSETSSKYFGAPAASNTRVDRSVPQVSRRKTMREKLMKIMAKNDEKMSDN